MSKRKKFWLIFSGASVLLVVLILGGFVVVYNRLELVDRGLAHPTFPYMRYSQNELNEMYPQYVNVDVATTRTPEETHRLFVDKLKEGDFDGAVECCFVREDWEVTKNWINKIQEQGYFEQMISDLDTKIEVEFMGDTLASYNYYAERDGKLLGSVIEFIKDSNGIWLIESL